MNSITPVLSILLIISIISLLLLIRLTAKGGLNHKNKNEEVQIERLKIDLLREISSARQETIQAVQTNMRDLGQLMVGFQKETTEVQDKRLIGLNDQLKAFSMQSEQKLEHIRATMENRITAMQEDNGKKLELMRATVDEKLQKTLEDRISQSFKMVGERLEQVYKGLGEMQTLAIGVGDLKKVLSNVKTRGILGEIQLGAILEEILSQEQYEMNIATKKGSADRVEYAVKLPGDACGAVYLPIDAKFPADGYSRLVEAYDTGDQVLIAAAAIQLERSIKAFAKSIHDKYIDPPNTTDFGIMFLPFEGLYAEVVRRGMVETLQREYKINIAGPTTMAALLNSLQMGFKTLAIQKHSSEVWNVLGAVKTEFDKFGSVLALTQQRLEQAHTELDKLVGARTRKIQSKLRLVTSMPEDSSKSILELDLAEEDFTEELKGSSSDSGDL